MISSVKQHGSYILKVRNIYSDYVVDVENETPHDTSCCMPSTWTALDLLSVIPYNHDTSIFRFALPVGSQKLGLPLGGFLLVKVPAEDHDGCTPTLRPYTNINDEDIINVSDDSPAYFEIMCKRYDQWGEKESPTTHFLFTRTDHSYRPPGITSNYIHSLRLGQTLSFKFVATDSQPICSGRIGDKLSNIKTLTMIAVGVGIAPMIQILRHIFRSHSQQNKIEKVVLLYGVRTVKDILLRELLEEWQERYEDVFTVVFCVGSRWNNIHWGAKSKNEFTPPPLPVGFTTLKQAELGWVNEEKILKYASLPTENTKLLVCGLPGVYDKICGHREDPDLSPDSALFRLGYTKEMVIKL